MENQTTQNPIQESSPQFEILPNAVNTEIPSANNLANQPTSPTPLVPPKTKGNIIPILIIIFILIVLVLAGIWAYQNYMVSPKLSKKTSIPTPTATANPTADWGTYINQKYLYSFKYPTNVILTTTISGTGLMEPDSQTSNFDISTPEVKEEAIFVNALDYIAPLINMDQWESIDIKINNKEIETYKNKNVETESNKILYRFKDDKKEIQVDFILTFKGESKLKNTLEQILSTFKFLEATPSASPNI